MNKNARILVISHTCFRETDSNGRTLGNMLFGCRYEKLAQFYIQNAYPDFKYCSDYFRVTDADVMHNIFKHRCGVRICEPLEQNTSCANNGYTRPRKSIFKMILRDLAWKSNLWWKSNFSQWLDEIHPNIILVQAGDGAFMFKLAMKIAKKYKAKIMVFNTEGYYFKDHDFVSKSQGGLLYKIYIRNFRKIYKKLVTRAEITIYNNDKLKTDYDRVIKHNSTVIYCPASNVEKYTGEIFKDQFVYMGNLGVGRFDTLMNVADGLGEINSKYKLLIYGRCTDEQLKELEKHKNAEYRGFVSYDEVIKLTQSSEYIIHVESFDEYFVEDSKYAFSTKIADCLAHSNNFIVIAPKSLASSEYLLNSNSAFVISDKQNISKQLNDYLSNRDLQNKIRQNAAKTASKNHSKAVCVEQMNKLLE